MDIESNFPQNWVENQNQAVSSSEAPWQLPVSLCDAQLLEKLECIPGKLAFKIGEVAELLGIKQYVLRYWETEFEQLKPKKSGNGQRIYLRRDVEMAFLVQKLLHRDRFSIEGARTALKAIKTDLKKEKNWKEMRDRLQEVKSEVDDLIQEIHRVRRLFL